MASAAGPNKSTRRAVHERLENLEDKPNEAALRMTVAKPTNATERSRLIPPRSDSP